MEHVTCLGCGCACDDIGIDVVDNRIVEARQACELGRQWFGDGRIPLDALIDGQPAPAEHALAAAAALLGAAARPLVFLAPDLSCEAQREAVGLADALRGMLDSVTSATAMSGIVAAQERGRAAATLGEVRNRADLLIFWGVDPSLRYPRYATRYAPMPEGVHAANGRRSRLVVSIDVGDAAGPADADLRITVSPAGEMAALTELASLLGSSRRIEAAAGRTAAADAGLADDPMPALRDLATRLRAARYAVIVADAEAGPGVDASRSSALIVLAQAINGPTRGALSLLRAGGNRSGADAVMTAQTGYPAAVDFLRGHPRYRPLDGGALARLTRGEVDSAVILGSADRIPANLRDLLTLVPAVAIGPRASAGAFAGSRVVIDTGVAGIHDAGTAMRMDDVPLPLRPVIAGARSAAPTIRALVDRLARR